MHEPFEWPMGSVAAYRLPQPPLPLPTADLLALGYIASRIVYGFLYIAGLGTLRSLVWCLGLACIIGLFVIAAA